MADLSLKIKADPDEAIRAFKSLADSSEDARKKIEKFTEGFSENHVDKFIDRQKFAGAAITATKGDLAALEAQHAAYGREIERLIKSGLSPEHEAVKTLQKEYDGLTKEIEVNNAARKMQDAAVKAAIGGLAAIGAAIGAAAGFSLKAAAANEDMIASFAPMMGGDFAKAGNLFKNIQKEAAATPFEIDAISASVRALMPAMGGSSKAAMETFKMLGDTAQGNSQKLESITNVYAKAQMTGKVSMKELQTIAGAGVPIFSEMSKSMGISTAELTKMSSEGKLTADHLKGAFQMMTSEGGLFFNGMETASDTFNMRILGIKENLGILAGVIGENLLPAAKEIAGKVLDAVTSFTAWIQEGDNLKKLIDTLTYVLAGLTAGLVAFLVVTKGAAALQAIATAFRALNAAIAANPIGAIAVLITAVLIPALIYLIKNWDTVQTYISQGVARLEYAFKWFASQIKEKFIIAVNSVKIGFLSLAEIIVTKVLGTVGNLLEVLSRLGLPFDGAAAAVRRFTNGFSEATEQARENSRASIQVARDEQDECQRALDAKLSNIDTEARARRAAIEENRRTSTENADAEIAETEAVEAAKAAIETDAKKKKKQREKTELELFRERLNETLLTEQQAHNQRLESVTGFLEQRAQLESDDFALQLEYIETHKQEMLALYEEGSAERIAIEEALALTISGIQQKQADFERKILEERLGAFTQFTSGFGQLLDTMAEKNTAAAVLSRALASAEAAINSYLAFTKVLASGLPFPLNGIAAAGVLASGLAQQIKIHSTPLPSAETGGRFVVPDVSARNVDGVGLRVNPGETVDITPRGETSGQVITINLIVDGAALAQVINQRIRSGEIYNLQPARNL